MIKISKRLQCVAQNVNRNSSVLAVGTDHGLLTMYLIENKIAQKVIASDVIQSIVDKTSNPIAAIFTALFSTSISTKSFF